MDLQSVDMDLQEVIVLVDQFSMTLYYQGCQIVKESITLSL